MKAWQDLSEEEQTILEWQFRLGLPIEYINESEVDRIWRTIEPDDTEPLSAFPNLSYRLKPREDPVGEDGS